MAEVTEPMAQQGLMPVGSTSAEFAAFQNVEFDRFVSAIDPKRTRTSRLSMSAFGIAADTVIFASGCPLLTRSGHPNLPRTRVLRFTKAVIVTVTNAQQSSGNAELARSLVDKQYTDRVGPGEGPSIKRMVRSSLAMLLGVSRNGIDFRSQRHVSLRPKRQVTTTLQRGGAGR